MRHWEEEVRETTIQDIKDQENRKIQIAEEIDGIISEACKEIKEHISSGWLCAGELKALAKLIAARAQL